MLCLACNHSLEETIDFRCPKCGRAFDPMQPSTLNQSGRPISAWSRWWLRAPAWPIIVFVLVPFFGLFWENTSPVAAMTGRFVWDYLFWGPLFVIFVLLLRGVQRSVRSYYEKCFKLRPHSLESWRRFLMWPIVLAIVVCGTLIIREQVPMQIGFMISAPAMDRIADAALKDPARADELAGQWVGVYRIEGVEVIGKTVVLYVHNKRGSYGFARVPAAIGSLIQNFERGAEGPGFCPDFPRVNYRGPVGSRIGGNWFVMYSLFGWS